MTIQRKLHGVWSSRWTFILAVTGSTAGLGNIWRFPYLVGENGGGLFILVYFLCIALIGIPLMMAEISLGRKSRQSPIHAMRDLVLETSAARYWVLIGWFGVVAGLVVLSYYSVIAGWGLEYLFAMGAGEFNGLTTETANSIFSTLMANQSQLIKWQSIFLLSTLLVVSAGVVKGLGIAVHILVPAMFVCLFILVLYSMRQGDFGTAFVYLFSFKPENFSYESIVVAMGHAFFTLSIGMGAMMAYGAYMPDKASIGSSVVIAALFDTLIGLSAGLAVLPLIFASPLLNSAEGPGLLFISLPVVFGNLTGGEYYGAVFFVLVSLAAWTSAISLLEPAVAWLVETRFCGRLVANLVLGALVWLLGLGTVYSFHEGTELFRIWGMSIYHFLDYMITKLLLPISGILIALFVGWVMRRDTVRHELKEDALVLFEWWLATIRYLTPVTVLLIVVFALTNFFADY